MAEPFLRSIWYEYGASTDTTPPDTSIITAPAAFVNTASVSITYTGTDDVTAPENLAYEASVDGGAFAPITSGSVNNTHIFGPLAEGPHTIDIRAKDEAGNVDPTPVSVAFTVDLTQPDTTITSAPSGTVNSTNATIAFTGTDNITAPSNLVFEASLDSGAFAVVVSPLNLVGLSNGPHTILVRAIDEAGNVDTTPASASWVVDATAPGAVSGFAVQATGDSAFGAASWLETGDDGSSGTATARTIKRRRAESGPVTELNFATSETVTDPQPAMAVSGTLRTMLVSVFVDSSATHFGMKVMDDAGNFGPLATATYFPAGSSSRRVARRSRRAPQSTFTWQR